MKIGQFIAIVWLAWSGVSCQSRPGRLPAESPSASPSAAPLSEGQSLPDQIQTQDPAAIAALLQAENLQTQMQAWRGKLLVVKFTPSPGSFKQYSYGTDYQDRNGNGLQDPEDAGFFNPASTVKVALAALALEKLQRLDLPRDTAYRAAGSQQWQRIDADIRRALVISDNEATNRLVLWLGFDPIQQTLRRKGLEHLAINRLMLSKAGPVTSPAFDLRAGNQLKAQEPQSVSVPLTCQEAVGQVGNCATAADLVGVLMRLVQPEAFRAEQRFDLRPTDRVWMQAVMAQTPRQAGFDYADDYCRFLDPLGRQMTGQGGRLLSKCGTALFSSTYVDSSVVETVAGEKYYLLLAVTPPQGTPEPEILAGMQRIVGGVLPRLPINIKQGR
jgi:hypothetical protein